MLPGAHVHARGLTWEVVHAETAGDQRRIRLRCLEGDIRGTEFDFLHPAEEIRSVNRNLDPARAGRLQHWRLYHEAFLMEQALGATGVVAAEPGRLDLPPYQLVPLMRALEMGRPRLLLADGVGLGKTVEAAIIVTELIARRRAHRVLIVSPAGPLLNQWDQELRMRFGLRFRPVTDWGSLQEVRRTLELGANPFDSIAYCLISIDFAKQEKVLQDLERASWDVVIIDEAHHCVRLGNAGDSEDSLRRRLAEVLARQSDGLLLLTATPHDGFDNHFASLIDLLDPSLVDGRGALRGDGYRRLVVRRLKSHIRDPKTGECLFKVREVTPHPVVFSQTTHPAFSTFQAALLELVAPRLKRAVRQRRYGEVLAFLALLKRSVSSVVACRNTLRVIAERYGTLQSEAADRHELRRQRLRTLRDYRRRLERYGVLSFEEEQDQARLEAEDMAHELLEGGAEELVDKLKTLEREGQRTRDHSRRVDKTLTALQGLVRLAEQAIDEDPKPPALLGQIEDIRGTEPRANILVYTEYTDSQEVAVGFLSEAKTKGRLKGEIIAIKGDDGEKARTAAATRFATEDGLILVSTDAMSEGLNLHQRCHYLIHLELPYNPNRLEQRNGRIDRYGQRETPRVQYLYLAGTFEERLLLRLVAKYERQRARLTFVPNTLGLLTSETGLITVKLLEGLAEEQGCLFTRPPTQLKMLEGNEDEDTGSPAYQELLAEVERAISGFEKASKSRDWLSEAGLNAEQSRLDAATEALDESRELLAPIDLIAFVRQAIEADAGLSNALSEEPDGALRLKLSRDWMYGLDDLPGYDAEQRVLRLTRDRARQTDDEDRPLGYIGRAHPIVRRALDRVRHFQAGTGDALLDRRVSAVRGEAGQPPTLVYTYLCAVRSDDDAEYERVIAVRFSEREGPLALTEPAAWLAQAAPERQVPTRGVWERHFARWATPASDAASDAAQQAFAPLGEVVIRARYEELDRERREIDAWFRTRVDDLCGKAVAVTGDLFTPVESSGSRWQSLTEPKERVATVASDRANPSARRREAEGVLTLYERRIEDLSRRKRLRIEAPSPLGLLMLIPAKDHG